MPFSYDPALLATNAVYQIRAEIQDTDSQDPQLLDEEIAFSLTVERNFWCASARCAEMIGRKVLRKADVKLGRSMQVTYTKMAQQWFDMARMLRNKAMGTVVPWAGGMNIADQLNYMQDTSLIQPVFREKYDD